MVIFALHKLRTLRRCVLLYKEVHIDLNVVSMPDKRISVSQIWFQRDGAILRTDMDVLARLKAKFPN